MSKEYLNEDNLKNEIIKDESSVDESEKNDNIISKPNEENSSINYETEEESAYDDNKANGGIKGQILSFVGTILLCVVLIYINKHFLFFGAEVDGESMENTLQNNERLIVAVLPYKLHDPERFDIVVFKVYDSDIYNDDYNEEDYKQYYDAEWTQLTGSSKSSDEGYSGYNDEYDNEGYEYDEDDESDEEFEYDEDEEEYDEEEYDDEEYDDEEYDGDKLDSYYIKRIIGLPGETVRIDMDGNIYIDDVLLEENYGKEKIEFYNRGRAIVDVKLGEDEYFVMGDNRNASDDSRYGVVGNLEKEKLCGKAVFRFWPPNKFGGLE